MIFFKMLKHKKLNKAILWAMYFLFLEFKRLWLIRLKEILTFYHKEDFSTKEYVATMF